MFNGQSKFFRSGLAIRLIAGLLGVALLSGSAMAQTAQPLTPGETVREFYKALRERRFREAFALSIYKPAVDPLTPEEFEELKPDFEKLAKAVSEKIEIVNEQINGDDALVMAKVGTVDPSVKQEPEPVALVRVNGVWIVGDAENREVVAKEGREFFFRARIDTHHTDAQEMLKRIALVQLAYSQQHAGIFGDLKDLIAAGMLGNDMEGTESTGYRFHIELAKDKKSYTAGAEPAKYGRTGKLSFYMDSTGIRSADLGGKPLKPVAP